MKYVINPNRGEKQGRSTSSCLRPTRHKALPNLGKHFLLRFHCMYCPIALGHLMRRSVIEFYLVLALEHEKNAATILRRLEESATNRATLVLTFTFAGTNEVI